MSGLNPKKLLIGTLVVLAGLVSAYWLIASPMPAQKSGSTEPKITWSEKQIEVLLSPGESASKTLTFSSTLDLSDARIEVVPEIAPFLSIQSSSFVTVPANQPRDVAVDFHILPNANFSTFDGTVHVKVGSQTLPSTLKLVIHVAGSGAAIFLPPDPGEAGKTTLEGIDSDRDGVRDDIQRHIALTYPSSERTRAALTQTAMAFGQTIIGSQDQSSALSNLSGLARSQDCLFYVRGVRGGMTALREFQANYLNTDLRSSRWLMVNGLIGGQTFRLPDQDNLKSSCIFDPDVLRN